MKKVVINSPTKSLHYRINLNVLKYKVRNYNLYIIYQSMNKLVNTPPDEVNK